MATAGRNAVGAGPTTTGFPAVDSLNCPAVDCLSLALQRRAQSIYPGHARPGSAAHKPGFSPGGRAPNSENQAQEKRHGD
jgi:hypothetical protein